MPEETPAQGTCTNPVVLLHPLLTKDAVVTTPSFNPLVQCQDPDHVTGVLISHSKDGRKNQRSYLGKNLTVTPNIVMPVFTNVAPGDYTFIATHQTGGNIVRLAHVLVKVRKSAVKEASAKKTGEKDSDGEGTRPKFLLTIDFPPPGGNPVAVGRTFTSTGTSDWNTITNVAIVDANQNPTTFGWTCTAEPSSDGGDWTVVITMAASTPIGTYSMTVTDDGNESNQASFRILR